MKSSISILGILFIIVGIVTLAYQGFTYTKQDQIAQIGDVKLTADTQKTVYIPPYLGGAALVAGVVLIAIRRKS